MNVNFSVTTNSRKRMLVFVLIACAVMCSVMLVVNMAMAATLTDEQRSRDISIFDFIDSKSPRTQRQLYRNSSDGLCNVSSAVTLLNRRLAYDGIGGEFSVKQVLASNGCTNIKQVDSTHYTYSGNTDNWWSKKYYNGLATYTLTHTTITNPSKERIAELLSQHPEGIAVRNTKANHVIVFYRYSYSNGQYKLYVKDPSGNYSGIYDSNSCLIYKRLGGKFLSGTNVIAYIKEAHVDKKVQEIWLSHFNGEDDRVLDEEHGDQLLGIGETYQVKANILPENATNKAVEWTSSDPSVATISSTGLITTVDIGDTLITCKAKDGSGISSSFWFTVFSYGPSLRLQQNEVSLFVGDTVALEPVVRGAESWELNWVSDNEAVATVDNNGNVRAKAQGSTLITAILKADDITIQKTCNVKVIDPSINTIQFNNLYYPSSYGVDMGGVSLANVGGTITSDYPLTEITYNLYPVGSSTAITRKYTVPNNQTTVKLSSCDAYVKYSEMKGKVSSAGGYSYFEVIAKDITGNSLSGGVYFYTSTGTTLGSPAYFSKTTADPQKQAEISYNGNLYELYSTGGYTWQQADAYATSQGGHLAVISDANENKAVQSMVQQISSFSPATNAAWLGGYKNGSSWIWENAEPFNYTNWYKTSSKTWPSNAGGSPNYIGMYKDGTWHNGANDAALYRAFVVEYENDEYANAEILLNQYQLNVNKGDTLQLSAEVTGCSDTALTWSSNNPAVVSVDGNGNLTCNDCGNAVITVCLTGAPRISSECAVNVRTNAANTIRFNNLEYPSDYHIGDAGIKYASAKGTIVSDYPLDRIEFRVYSPAGVVYPGTYEVNGTKKSVTLSECASAIKFTQMKASSLGYGYFEVSATDYSGNSLTGGVYFTVYPTNSGYTSATFSKAVRKPQKVANTTYNGHYYEVYSTNGYTWHEANTYARSLGGYLAVVDDSNENNTIKGLLSDMSNWPYTAKAAWLGGYKNGTAWTWINGNSISYTNWYSNSNMSWPTGSGGVSDYIGIYKDGYWHDAADASALYGGFVVEYDSIDGHEDFTDFTHLVYDTSVYRAICDLETKQFPYSRSESTGSYSVGSVFDTTEFVQNARGEIWAELADGSYAYFGDISLVRHITPVITIGSDLTLPNNLTKGSSFALKGTLNSNVTINSVRGQIAPSSVFSTLAPASPDNELRFDISTTSINSRLKFGELSEGCYVYRVMMFFNRMQPDGTVACNSTANRNGLYIIYQPFTVGNAKLTKITGINVTGDTDYITNIGGEIKLTANAVPSSASLPYFLWESSNENVAQVCPDGTVRAIGVGNACITAKAVDGSNISASYYVHVGEKEKAFVLGDTTIKFNESGLVKGSFTATHTGTYRFWVPNGSYISAVINDREFHSSNNYYENGTQLFFSLAENETINFTVEQASDQLTTVVSVEEIETAVSLEEATLNGVALKTGIAKATTLAANTFAWEPVNGASYYSLTIHGTKSDVYTVIVNSNEHIVYLDDTADHFIMYLNAYSMEGNCIDYQSFEFDSVENKKADSFTLEASVLESMDLAIREVMFTSDRNGQLVYTRAGNVWSTVSDYRTVGSDILDYFEYGEWKAWLTDDDGFVSNVIHLNIEKPVPTVYMNGHALNENQTLILNRYGQSELVFTCDDSFPEITSIRYELTFEDPYGLIGVIDSDLTSTTNRHFSVECPFNEQMVFASFLVEFRTADHTVAFTSKYNVMFTDQLELGENTVFCPEGCSIDEVFSADKDGYYVFYTTGSYDTVMSCEYNGIEYMNDDGGENFNASLCMQLNAGDTVVIRTKLYDSSLQGQFGIRVEKREGKGTLCEFEVNGEKIGLQDTAHLKTYMKNTIKWNAVDGAVAYQAYYEKENEWSEWCNSGNTLNYELVAPMETDTQLRIEAYDWQYMLLDSCVIPIELEEQTAEFTFETSTTETDEGEMILLTAGHESTFYFTTTDMHYGYVLDDTYCDSVTFSFAAGNYIFWAVDADGRVSNRVNVLVHPGIPTLYANGNYLEERTMINLLETNDITVECTDGPMNAASASYELHGYYEIGEELYDEITNQLTSGTWSSTFRIPDPEKYECYTLIVRLYDSDGNECCSGEYQLYAEQEYLLGENYIYVPSGCEYVDGYFTVPEDGAYAFYSTNTEGEDPTCSIICDGIITYDDDSGDNMNFYQEVWLTEGTRVTVRVAEYERNMGAYPVRMNIEKVYGEKGFVGVFVDGSETAEERIRTVPIWQPVPVEWCKVCGATSYYIEYTTSDGWFRYTWVDECFATLDFMPTYNLYTVTMHAYDNMNNDLATFTFYAEVDMESAGAFELSLYEDPDYPDERIILRTSQPAYMYCVDNVGQPSEAFHGLVNETVWDRPVEKCWFWAMDEDGNVSNIVEFKPYPDFEDCPGHQFEVYFTNNYTHWFECSICHYIYWEEHGSCAPDATECAVCGQAREECLVWTDAHHIDGAYSYDVETHFGICSVCGEEFAEYHYANCSNPDYCEKCGRTVSEDHIEINQFLHDIRYESWCADDYSHWGECYDCGKIADFWPHNDNDGDGYCDQEYCGHIMPEEEPDIRTLPVRMGQSEADVFKGDQLRLVIRGLPDGVTQEGASWSSSDPSVVTVDENGIILITGAGKATVKAVLSDGLETYCRLTAYSHVEDIRATVDRSQICKIGDTLNLNVIFTPENPKLESCTFSSSNENVATVSENGVITCVGTGAAVITVVPVDNGSMSAKVAIVCPGTNTFTVPSSLKQIDAEAFSGTGIEYVILNDGTAMIGDLAFAGCDSLYAAVIPDTVKSISEDAFADCGTVVIITPEGSYASQYAEQHMLPVIHY